MKKSYKIAGIILVAIVLIMFVLSFFADSYVEGKLREQIKNIPSHITIDYDSMDFNTFKGNLIFKKSKIKFRDPETDSLVSVIEINDLSILDISYLEYIKNKSFIIQKLELNNPIITHRFIKVNKDSIKIDSSNKDPWSQKLLIEEFIINNAIVKVKEFETDSLIFSADRSNIAINEVLIDSTMGDLIPFKYDSYSGNLKDLYYKIGDYEGLEIKEVEFLPRDIKFKEIALKTKYDRQTYNRMLPEERDWFNIEIDSLRLKNSEFGKVNDSINMFVADSTLVYQPRVEIYRNKLLPDEFETKKYYSKVLRELPFDLTLNTLLLENGFVSYEEKVIEGHLPGKLEFSEFYTTVHDFSNTYGEGVSTSIDVKTKFMETTPLTVNWTFDKNDLQDAYKIQGELGSIDTQVLNQFTNRNVNVMLEGTLHKTYFSIVGNDFNSNIDIKINYDDFKINLINDKTNKRKSITNAIVNIFVRKDSDKADDNFREGSATVTRNKYGSFYNNLWLNLSAGLKKAITGDAK